MKTGIEASREMRGRARDFGIAPGILPPGMTNTIVDVDGVLVGQETWIRGDEVRTGATAILPHGENLFRDKVPAGLSVANGYGKLMGATQVLELGEIETPIVLTNTFSVPRAAEAILDWTLAYRGNESVRSVNPVVGETNDGRLNAIEKRVPTVEAIRASIERASAHPPAEGNVGAGTGTVAFGWKGGLGTSSRQLPKPLGAYRVGVLVQANFGGVLQILGVPIGQRLGKHFLHGEDTAPTADGSIMIVLATDAPLSDRNLTRLSRRTFAGLARTGASFVNGSGDYAIAFSTAKEVRRPCAERQALRASTELTNDAMSPLFQAAIEATEEAIYNALFAAETMQGRDGIVVEALPIRETLDAMRAHRVIE